jgi:nonribosomal peptide synthetase CepB
VSWRILLPDLAEAYAAVTEGREAALDPVGVSFRHWARSLAEQAVSARRVGELAEWTQMLRGADAPAAWRLDPERDAMTTVRLVSETVESFVTSELLTRVPAAFHTGVDEVLLAALALALAQWRRQRGDLVGGGILVDVEGHGREPLAPGMELSRTVGWFTSVNPVRLDVDTVSFERVCAGEPEAGTALKRVKEQLRQVPGDGLGFGLLRYLNRATGPALARLPAPQIVFNYLGRFATGAVGDGSWQPVGRDAFGGGADDRMTATHAIEASAMVRDEPGGPELVLSVSWPRRLLAAADVVELLAAWKAALAGMADHVARPGAGGHTPSDFSLVNLAQDQIDELEAEFADRR